MSEAKQNTDRLLWEQVPGDYYSPSKIYATAFGAITICVGGRCITRTPQAWFASTPPPEQPVYGIATWTVGIVSGQLHRECGGIVEEWRNNQWYASGADKGWFRKHTAPLTAEQVELLFGRAALEEAPLNGHWWWDNVLFRNAKAGYGTEAWLVADNQGTRKWLGAHCPAGRILSATRASIIEKFPDGGPLK